MLVASRRPVTVPSAVNVARLAVAGHLLPLTRTGALARGVAGAHVGGHVVATVWTTSTRHGRSLSSRLHAIDLVLSLRERRLAWVATLR